MKKTLATILIIGLPLILWSQQALKPYQVNHSEVRLFLDSISNSFNEHLTRKEKMDYSVFVTTGYQYYVHTFGENIKLLKSPINGSDYMEILKFGDSLFIPKFSGIKDIDYPIFTYSCGDMCSEFYYFCVTRLGNYGFIESKDFVFHNSIQPIIGTDYLIYKSHQSAIVKKDFTKYKFINSSNINISEDKTLIVYSIAKNNENYDEIFTFQLNNWTEKYLTTGYSPNFLKKSIVYWTQTKNELEQVRIFDLKTNLDKAIFTIPDSLTLWTCDPDYCHSENISVNTENSNEIITLRLCPKKKKTEDSDECTKRIIIKINVVGKLVETR